MVLPSPSLTFEVMKKNESTFSLSGQWPALLSLLLLGSFLGFYLYSTFRAEKIRLEREMGYVFSDAVRQVEDGMIENLVFLSNGHKGSEIKRVELIGPTHKEPAQIEIQEEIVSDSLPGHVKMEVNKFNYIDVRKDTLTHDEHSIQVKRWVGDSVAELNLTSTTKEITGMLSWWENIVPDSSGHSFSAGDSTFSLEKYKPLIISKMKEELSKDNLKLTFQLLPPSESAGTRQVIASYRDIGSGEELQLEMPGNFWQISRNILPQILTTLALFCFVGLSYFLMHRQYRKNRELLVFQNDFISNMTHELKTPMATMNVALEALQNFGIDKEEKRKEYLQIARTEAEKLGGLVDKALSVSKMSPPDSEVVSEEINLQSWLEEVLSPIRLLAGESDASVLVDIKSPIMLVTRPEILKSILVNLLDNALKYGDAEQPVITVSARKNTKGVEISVSDNGSPIPPSQRDLIFQKFYRIPTQGESHAVKGYGLGLYLVKELTGQLGGSVSLKVTDTSNHFIISLPNA